MAAIHCATYQSPTHAGCNRCHMPGNIHLVRANPELQLDGNAVSQYLNHLHPLDLGSDAVRYALSVKEKLNQIAEATRSHKQCLLDLLQRGACSRPLLLCVALHGRRGAVNTAGDLLSAARCSSSQGKLDPTNNALFSKNGAPSTDSRWVTRPLVLQSVTYSRPLSPTSPAHSRTLQTHCRLVVTTSILLWSAGQR